MPCRGSYRGPLVALMCLLGGCLSERDDDSELQGRREALAFGVQGFARFDAAGNTVPGSAATTIGSTVSAVRTAAGSYTVTFGALAAIAPDTPGQGGTLQVVAVGAGNARCTLATGWTFSADHSVIGKVVCRSPGVGLTDSGFFAYYGRGPGSSGRAAYARVNSDASVPAATKFSSSGAAITASRPAIGAYWVFMTAEPREQLQVTAISSSAHCHPALRELGVTTVRCFDSSGAPVNAAFTVNQAGTNALALTGVGAFAQVRGDGSLDTRYDFNACPLGTTTSSRTDVGRYLLSHTLVAESPSSYQVSAYDNGPSYCKLESVAGPGTTATSTVACYSAAGAPADVGFVSSYGVLLGDCGGCPSSCEGGTCKLGVCQPVTVVSGVKPRSVGANASTIFFSHEPGPLPSNPLLMSVPRSGGMPATLFASVGIRLLDSVVVGPSDVYWYEGGDGGLYGVYRKPLPGGARARFAAGGLLAPPRAVSLVGSNLYFADALNSQLYRVSSGGATTPLLPSTIENPYPYNIATDSTHVSFINDNGTRVARVALTGGEPLLLASLSDHPPPTTARSAITTDGAHVYFATSFAPNKIYRVPVAGGAVSVFEWTSGLVTALAISGVTLFWTVEAPGAVMSKPLAGGTPRTFASGESSPRSLFVDATTVIWANADAIRKVAR